MSDILKGKVVLVTGGSRGLGAATAEAFADQGADVAISYAASADKAATVVEKLRAKGVRAIAVKSDQADLASAKPLIDRVIAEFGKLDILVNNAAIAIQGQNIDDPTLDGEKYNRQWQVNVLGTIANTRAAAPRLTDGGRIIFVGSLLGSYVPFPGVADYAGTKWALVGYAKGIARELGPRNITVNVVQPGIMPTDMAAEVAGELPNRDAILDMHPIRRIATLEEVSQTICFLAGPHAGYINGEQINIAGGLAI
ncbi:SDR family NAD(P)-dependent oxidoreductase [Rhizobium lentis]|uniref:SDR family oxidoreductase n=1 Tax=Rhizobium lentis TaxID=1138194 RepID=A0ABS7IEB7_9HYPH|nr:SDR family oxidoreductase [Rhizobium lentis]MBX4997295.1 SDR family oxidoreductase [Rhizobium lentis]MBX5015129.1 SDR family oxidoreductase [Rhizobium lentis]MBX5039669.1 SDR family oxidoreductase [Rhizobium lentis]MBX5052618.1 SDR family oxidoreductase [Rhizobium lentis]MBX5064129.1 SDR family oxidoreductase [Rhizobium lentis]